MVFVEIWKFFGFCSQSLLMLFSYLAAHGVWTLVIFFLTQHGSAICGMCLQLKVIFYFGNYKRDASINVFDLETMHAKPYRLRISSLL
jgi:hypothetical protein